MCGFVPDNNCLSQDFTAANITPLANIFPQTLHSCFLFGYMLDNMVSQFNMADSSEPFQSE